MKTEIVEAWIMFQLLDNKKLGDIKYIAVDKNGDVFGFWEKPFLKTTYWDTSYGAHAHMFKLPEKYHKQWVDWDCTVFEIK